METVTADGRNVVGDDDEDGDSKGSFTIIDIYESVQRVRFLMTPTPLPQSVL